MSDKKLILIGGGARSGKSDYALAIARRLGSRKLFIATAQAGDAEMHARIALHQRSRGTDFDTLEEPLALPEAISSRTDYDVLVIDCLTLWITNHLMAGRDLDDLLRCVDDLRTALRRRTVHCIVVTNEVGLGLVPETSLGRTFRDVIGIAHQRLADVADEVYLSVMGVMLRLKPGPVMPVSLETAR